MTDQQTLALGLACLQQLSPVPGYRRHHALGPEGFASLIKRNGWRHTMVGGIMDAKDREDVKEWKARKSPSHWVRSREERPEPLDMWLRMVICLFDWLSLGLFMSCCCQYFPPSDSSLSPLSEFFNDFPYFIILPLGLFLNFSADMKMPVDPPLALGVGVLLHTILPLNFTLFFYPLQLLSDMFGFNRGSNVGSCLYLTLAIGYVQYLGFPWPVPAGLLMYWFFKPHINNSVTWYSGIQCAFMSPTQQITLTYLVRTYRVANWGVLLHLLCLAFHVSYVFPWCIGWIKLPNYVYGFGPLNPCNMSIYDFIMKSAHLEPVKVAVVLALFSSFIICIYAFISIAYVT